MKKHVVFLYLSAVTMRDEGTTEEGQFIKLRRQTSPLYTRILSLVVINNIRRANLHNKPSI